ncbi:MAG: PfkB family carbohydrate kinase [Candidatus Limnocylindrales bacterium]
MTDAFVIGRIGVDLTPEEPRKSLADATRFVRSVGGFAGNIGIGLARLGASTAVISSVGDDGHGDHVRQALAAEGIDVRALLTRPASRTQVAFFEAWPPEHFPVTFYRPAPPPDTQLTLADVPLRELELAPVAIFSGTLFAAEPARSTTLELLQARAAAGSLRDASWTILDLDWRPTLWLDPGAYPGLVDEAARLSDVVIGSDSEFAAAGLRPGEVMDPGPALTVLKHGPDGVSLLAGGSRESLPGITVDVICGLGAGDALTAAFAAGLLAGLSPLGALERGNAAGAIVASRLMCSAAMPVADEIDEFLAGRSNDPMEIRR